MDKVTLPLLGEINDSKVEDIVHMLLSVGQDSEITLIINSGGGDMYSAHAIISMLERYNVNTVGLGMVGSAAVPIYLVGKTRYITDRTTIMLHSSTVDYGDITDTDIVQSIKDNQVATNQQYEDYIVERCKLANPALVHTWCKGETYLDFKDALEYGIATKLWNKEGLGSSKNSKLVKGG